MQKFEQIAAQILDFVGDPVQKTKRLISQHGGTRFVVCGTSGSGKSRAVFLANSSLPPAEKIAESHELLRERNATKAIEILEDTELEYEASAHIAFNVVNSYLAKALEVRGFKVFWLDNGCTGAHWKKGLGAGEV